MLKNSVSLTLTCAQIQACHTPHTQTTCPIIPPHSLKGSVTHMVHCTLLCYSMTVPDLQLPDAISLTNCIHEEEFKPFHNLLMFPYSPITKKPHEFNAVSTGGVCVQTWQVRMHISMFKSPASVCSSMCTHACSSQCNFGDEGLC